MPADQGAGAVSDTAEVTRRVETLLAAGLRAGFAWRALPLAEQSPALAAAAGEWCRVVRAASGGDSEAYAERLELALRKLREALPRPS